MVALGTTATSPPASAGISARKPRLEGQATSRPAHYCPAGDWHAELCSPVTPDSRRTREREATRSGAYAICRSGNWAHVGARSAIRCARGGTPWVPARAALGRDDNLLHSTAIPDTGAERATGTHDRKTQSGLQSGIKSPCKSPAGQPCAKHEDDGVYNQRLDFRSLRRDRCPIPLRRPGCRLRTRHRKRRAGPCRIPPSRGCSQAAPAT